MMTDTEIIEVVVAHAAGKKVQMRHFATAINPDPIWYDYPNQVGRLWDFMNFHWRIAPEPRKPREWAMAVEFGNLVQIITHRSYPPGALVRVREVIE